MKVKCIRNILPKELSIHESDYSNPILCNIGQEYLVMGIAMFNDGTLCYYTGGPSSYPWYSHHYFEVIDPKIPPSWTFNIIKGQYFIFILSFPERNSENFEHILFDGPGDSMERLIYKKRYQEVLDWYRDLEVEAYLEQSDFSDIDKLEILKYYRSKPISQWEDDKPFLLE